MLLFIETKISKDSIVLFFLQNLDNKNLDWDDDEELTELADPDAPTKPASAKKTKGLLLLNFYTM